VFPIENALRSIANMTGSLLDQRRAKRPWESDDELVAGIVRDALDDLESRPPVSVEIIASYFGISRVDVVPLPWAGCLIPVDGRVEIRLNEADVPSRRRFTAFHEVAHTFMPGFEHAVRFRCNPVGGSTRRDGLELLCDVGASELLLPHRYFTDDLASGAFGLDLVEELARNYQASLEATANRLVDLWPASEPVAFLSLELRNKPRDRADAPPALRVNNAHMAPGFPFAPRHKSIELGSLTALAHGLIEDVDETIRNAVLIGEQLGNVRVHARRYPHRDKEGNMKHRILALIRRLQPTSP
jgi:hypothetical protein